MGWLAPGGLAALLLLVVLAGELLDAAVDDVRSQDGIAGADRPLLTMIARHRAGWLSAVLRAVTWLGSPLVVAGVVAVAAAAVYWRTRRLRVFALAAVVLGGAELLETVTKTMVSRARPPLALRVAGVSADGSSFPSGHATLAAAGYGLIALLMAGICTRRAHRIALWASAVVVAGLVGVSRIYLGVHWASDVLTGWLLGGGVLLVAGCAPLLARWRTRVRRVDRHRRGSFGAPAPDAGSPR